MFIKIKHNDKVIKVQLGEDESLADLKANLLKRFPRLREDQDIQFEYVDSDGDAILVENDQDFRCYLEEFKTGNSKTQILRIIISDPGLSLFGGADESRDLTGSLFSIPALKSTISELEFPRTLNLPGEPRREINLPTSTGVTLQTLLTPLPNDAAHQALPPVDPSTIQLLPQAKLTKPKAAGLFDDDPFSPPMPAPPKRDDQLPILLATTPKPATVGIFSPTLQTGPLPTIEPPLSDGSSDELFALKPKPKSAAPVKKPAVKKPTPKSNAFDDDEDDLFSCALPATRLTCQKDPVLTVQVPQLVDVDCLRFPSSPLPALSIPRSSSNDVPAALDRPARTLSPGLTPANAVPCSNVTSKPPAPATTAATGPATTSGSAAFTFTAGPAPTSLTSAPVPTLTPTTGVYSLPLSSPKLTYPQNNSTNYPSLPQQSFSCTLPGLGSCPNPPTSGTSIFTPTTKASPQLPYPGATITESPKIPQMQNSPLFPSFPSSTTALFPATGLDAKHVHVGISCSVCFTAPITGKRFKSVNWSNFDLCEKCVEDPVYERYMFIMMKNSPTGGNNAISNQSKFQGVINIFNPVQGFNNSYNAIYPSNMPTWLANLSRLKMRNPGTPDQTLLDALNAKPDWTIDQIDAQIKDRSVVIPYRPQQQQHQYQQQHHQYQQQYQTQQRTRGQHYGRGIGNGSYQGNQAANYPYPGGSFNF